jgi:hypothetical protein
MADNTGNYVSEAKLLIELVNGGKGTKSSIVLSNKAGNTFDFSPASPAPEVGDRIVYGDYQSQIQSVAGSQLTLVDATVIENGGAYLVKMDILDIELTDLILNSMDFIDKNTRQFFNKREFTIEMEGTNSDLLLLPVPIIAVTSLYKNSEAEALDSSYYRVFNGRTSPDDRRNPRIKMMSEESDVLYTGSSYFMRGSIQKIVGSFGFLEEDGSTPRMIQRACLKLATMRGLQTIGESASQANSASGVGAIKREKTDLHEIEYYDANSNSSGDSGDAANGTFSGDAEIDRIIRSYKSPIVVTGTFPDFGREAPKIISLVDKRS